MAGELFLMTNSQQTIIHICLYHTEGNSGKRKGGLSLFFLSIGSSQAENTDDPFWNL